MATATDFTVKHCREREVGIPYSGTAGFEMAGRWQDDLFREST
ncbi:MAG: hypothetical protein XD72_1765 [Methanothrix harundinacea]|uniref:Uncharacterized protein n=1 Tax=Methanothrix harundinacea TaxID=301375 RepID=A0A101FSX0_9EURY|nr:MAG: hypothetical protein XD72_1765 [Methanothrix harundinacea]